MKIFAFLIVLAALETPLWAATAPEAEDDLYEVLPGNVLDVNAPGVLLNDTDADGSSLTAVLVSEPVAGGALEFSPDGSFRYTPPTDPDKEDSFVYRASDGALLSNEATVTILFREPTIPPIAAYTDEMSYLAGLAAAGFQACSESFENDAAWGAVRTTINDRNLARNVTSQGIIWSANNDTSEITTGPGPALDGAWGFFALPHGNYSTGTDCHLPGNCTDGWIGTSVTPLVAIGGWVGKNGAAAKIVMKIDDDPAKTVDFGDAIISGGARFFGVIIPAGFHRFEIREMEGKAEDQVIIFGDDFTFARLMEPCASQPVSFIRADANGDGSINIADPSFVANFVFGVGAATAPPCPDAADANGDGTINIADPSFIANFVFGVSPATPPPAPGTVCGPAELMLGCDRPPAACSNS